MHMHIALGVDPRASIDMHIALGVDPRAHIDMRRDEVPEQPSTLRT